MAIQFIPAPGMVLMCDFGPVIADIKPPGLMVGPLSVPPEMTKVRFVVILTQSVSRVGTCIVVPLSTKRPNPVKAHHHCIVQGTYRFLGGAEDSWVKADMLSAVSTQRLDRVLDNGRYTSPSLSTEDFATVRKCVSVSLGF